MAVLPLWEKLESKRFDFVAKDVFGDKIPSSAGSFGWQKAFSWQVLLP